MAIPASGGGIAMDITESRVEKRPQNSIEQLFVGMDLIRGSVLTSLVFTYPHPKYADAISTSPQGGGWVLRLLIMKFVSVYL